jgi:hypothetical protein
MFGAIVGFVAGLFLSNAFIFPAEVLSLKFAVMTIGDFLRIIGGVLVTLLATGIGGIIGGLSDD